MAKVLATIYLSVLFFFVILYLVYQIRDLMDKRIARKRMAAAREPEKFLEPLPAIDIVGKSTTVFLAPLIPAGNEPLMSEDLETVMQLEAETEPDVMPDEVETNLNAPYIPDEDELIQYANDDMDMTDELSQGLTFEQISHAVEVIEGKKTGETDAYLAGETLTVMPTDFLDMICMQADHEAMVKKLIAGYLDYPDKMKPAPVSVANFDINQYV